MCLHHTDRPEHSRHLTPHTCSWTNCTSPICTLYRRRKLIFYVVCRLLNDLIANSQTLFVNAPPLVATDELATSYWFNQRKHSLSNYNSNDMSILNYSENIVMNSYLATVWVCSMTYPIWIIRIKLLISSKLNTNNGHIIIIILIFYLFIWMKCQKKSRQWRWRIVVSMVIPNTTRISIKFNLFDIWCCLNINVECQINVHMKFVLIWNYTSW